MFTLLKMLHLLALVFGSAASLGNIYLALSAGPHDLAAPGYTNMLRKFYRYTALAAILMLWATGLMMMIWRYGWWVDSRAFDIKIGVAVLLTVIILWLNLMAPSWARRGGPPAYVPALHWTGAASLLVITALAAVAFA